ncbi:ribose 5-phosphate isomerase B [Salinicoccus halitifaciens]|uniref:Ribose 5-phosphate isomerase B n=1 Tax=Salinicoccus halitifaciens TaxID=1073415 RepID=A0ABV2E983_9STAP|nr:ribose 5-phosphate isomerase B [Salinicoccus halitifaciens]MCD2138127.1 ribose 5-phosphate isomerase B [Salinicoccus halitifaciens]
MKIIVGSDHGGFKLKRAVVEDLKEKGLDVTDFGPETADSVDYPDYAKPVAEKVASGEYDKGILICGTGIGMSISANKVKGIRSALVHDTFSARATRQHNDSNVLAMGERVIGEGLALDIVDIWLNTEFEGGRHERRVCKIEE